MGDETHTGEDLGSGSPADNPGYASYGVFSGSHHFTVAGGTCINTINTTKNYHTAPTVPSDFPRIPMGDVDLQREIRMDNWSGVVDIQPKRRSVRRVYSAKIDRGKSSVTVATYQGESAEEEWRTDVTKYMAVRHPNIVQLRGTASYGNIYATIFHDDLIPFREFEKQHRHSHLSNVYIAACVDTEFRAVKDYFDSTFQPPLIDEHCTCFIRHSTGRLCVDLEPGHDSFCGYLDLDQFFDQQNFKTLKIPSLEAAALNLLTLKEYHEICYWNFSHYRYACIDTSITVNLGAVISWPPGDRSPNAVYIASLPNAESARGSPWVMHNPVSHGDVVENGWTRFSTSDAKDTSDFALTFESTRTNYWLSQANHFGVPCRLESCAELADIFFFLSISKTTADLVEGFLFLCPPKDFQIDPLVFKWPECPAYWCLDPFGAKPLSWKDAAHLGFPSLKLSTEVCGYSWDASVYAGTRQFHLAKGFDPDSQDVARHLGNPLCELPSETYIPFAHIDDHNLYGASDEDDSTASITEPKNIVESTNADDAVSNASPPQSSGNSGLAPEMPVVGALKFVLGVQLALIIFLPLSALYARRV